MAEVVELNIEKAKALSSATRLKIFHLLKGRSMNVSDIAISLGHSQANISAQLKILEKVGLVTSHYEPGEHGVQKICTSRDVSFTI
ncbi:MAG: ArsR/SmtB family transcription factor [Promethearchaeota archaeon]